MHLLQESMRPLEGIPASLQSNWERRRQPWERRRYTWEQMEVLVTNVGVPVIVLATGVGNPPAVQVRTAMTVWFGSKPIQNPDPLHLCGPNLHPYLSIRGFCRVWLDPSASIAGSGIQVFLFIVAFRYPIANRKILTLGYHCPFLMYWPPL
jgi:hypothetical protein